MSNSIIIAGSGVSALQYAWPDDDMPIMAVSSGYNVVPRINHFVTMDKVMHFPEWLTDSRRFYKHVPKLEHPSDWRKCPNVYFWPYADCADPTFNGELPVSSGPLRKTNCDDRRHNSMLLAVQIAPRLGFDRLLFIGCDLLDASMYPVSDVLCGWWPAAKAAGIEWVNLSPISTLCEWMPTKPAILQEALA